MDPISYTSGLFVVLFFILVGVYRIVHAKWRQIILVLASYGVYASFDPKFCLLLLLSTVVDYHASSEIESSKAKGGTGRVWLGFSLCINLGILGIFKYFGFFVENVNRLFENLGLGHELPLIEIIFPIGISFYTFQTLGYTMDVYRGRQSACHSFVPFALYVSFFPQLINGPIERASRLLPQLDGRLADVDQIQRGAWLFFWGVFKKVFIADHLMEMSIWAYQTEGVEVAPDIWLVNIAFVIAFYCDFSGYTDIARGIAAWLGIRLTHNFNLPFLATGPGEFWRRWHISLSTWFRDYVYLPLSRWKGGRVWGVLVTMILVGFWHGAEWKYILWGALWGLLLLLERSIQPLWKSILKNRDSWSWIRSSLGWCFTQGAWTILGVLFVSQNLSQAKDILFLYFGPYQLSEYTLRDSWTILFYTWPLLVMQFCQWRTKDAEVFRTWPFFVKVLWILVCITLLLSSGSAHDREFIYFQF